MDTTAISGKLPHRTVDVIYLQRQQILRKLLSDNTDPCNTRFGILSSDELAVLEHFAHS